MSGEDESNDKKQIWLIRPNCFVRKDAVASGMTRNSQPCICSKSCIPMFDTAAILEESVIAACMLFLPPVFEDIDMTWTIFRKAANFVTRGCSLSPTVRTEVVEGGPCDKLLHIFNYQK
jgi:hypothetical protein